MVVSVVHETNRLMAQIAALERENEHLKEIVRVQADRLASRVLNSPADSRQACSTTRNSYRSTA